VWIKSLDSSVRVRGYRVAEFTTGVSKVFWLQAAPRGQILFRSAELVRTQKLARQPLYNPPMSTTAIAEALEGSIDWVMFRLLGRPATRLHKLISRQHE